MGTFVRIRKGSSQYILHDSCCTPVLESSSDSVLLLHILFCCTSAPGSAVAAKEPINHLMTWHALWWVPA